MDTALDRLYDRAQREVDERLPACQLAVARDGELLGFETFGEATNNTRFLIWSCTKGVFAGVIWQLIGEGLLDVDRTVASYLPEFATNGKEGITVEQLLLHTAGIPSAPLGPSRWWTSEGRREAFGRWRLNWEPGSRFEYHALSAWWVLAELALEVTGKDHRTLVAERVCDPLGLTSLRLGMPEDEQHDIAEVFVVGVTATPEECAAAGVFYGGPPTVPPDFALTMNAPAARAVGVPAGGAVSTAADVALYYQALLDDRLGLWDPAVLHDATSVIRNTFADVPKWGMPANRSRGLVVRGDHDLAHWMMHFGPGTSPHAFGHDGAGGQIAWADPETGLSFCFLTNGMDANGVHEALRNQDLARLAAACA